MTYYNQDGLKSLHHQIRNNFFSKHANHFRYSRWAYCGVHYSDSAVMADPSQSVPTGWETDAVNPSSTSCPAKLCHHLPKGHLGPHGVGAGFSSTSLMYAENTLRNEHTNMIQTANKRFISMLRDIDSVTKLQYTKSHLHLKSHDPAARSTLFGCQSKLRTVERMGFLMCLLTHLKKFKIIIRPVKQNNQWSSIYQLWPTNHFQTQSSKRIWVALRSPLQTCSPAETISQTWQHGWSWE